MHIALWSVLHMRYNTLMEINKRQNIIIGLLVGIIIVLLVIIGMLLSKEEVSSVDKDKEIPPVFIEEDLATTTLILDTDVETDDQFLVLGKYVPHSACIDYDTRTPYYTKTFLSGYTHVDGSPVVDTCVDMGMSTDLLVEFSCKGDELISEEFDCPFGCYNGACMLEKQAEVYSSQLDRSMFEWSDGSVDYSIVNAFIGKVIVPFGTLDNDGNEYTVGSTVSALTLSLSIKTKEADECIQNNLQRVMDESGRVVDSNTKELQFPFTGGCFVPAETQTYTDIVFIINPTETNFIIKTGNINGKTFIIEKDNNGNVFVDKTIEVG